MWKMFTMQHNRGSRSVCEVPSAVWFSAPVFWSETFEASQPFIPLQRAWIFWQNTWDRRKASSASVNKLCYCLVRKVPPSKVAEQRWLRKTSCLLLFFSNSPHKTDDFSHSIPYGKTASQDISQVTNTIPSWISSMRGGRVEPCDSFPELISANKRTPGEGNRQLTSGDWWLWSVGRGGTFQLGQVGIWWGRVPPNSKAMCSHRHCIACLQPFKG